MVIVKVCVNVRFFRDGFLILAMGIDGNEPNDGEVKIDIPVDLLISDCQDSIKEFIRIINGNSLTADYEPKFVQDRATLSPRIMMFIRSMNICSRIWKVLIIFLCYFIS